MAALEGWPLTRVFLYLLCLHLKVKSSEIIFKILNLLHQIQERWHRKYNIILE